MSATRKALKRHSVSLYGQFASFDTPREVDEWIEQKKCERRASFEAMFAAAANSSTKSRSDIADLYGVAMAEIEMMKDEIKDLKGSSNLFAKLGQALNDLTNALKSGCDLADAVRLSEESQKIFSLNKLVTLVGKAAAKSSARTAARALHSPGRPKADAKAFVYECWTEWRTKPTQYRSTAAFARAMLDTHPEELRSQPVVEGWVRNWRRSANVLSAQTK